MNATKSMNAFDLLRQMKSVTPQQVTQHIKAAAQAEAMIATTEVLPGDRSLVGMEDTDKYVDGVKLNLPGTSLSVGLNNLASFARRGMNIHFHGPKGTGKSRLIREVIKIMNAPTIEYNVGVLEENKARFKKDGKAAKFESYKRLVYTPYVYSCHEETQAQDDLMLCPTTTIQNGQRVASTVPGALLMAWAKELGGGVAVLEEIDTLLPGRMIVTHALLDGQSSVYKAYVDGEKIYTKYDNFVCFASSNTRGAGENSRGYAGTQIQNGAFMSRFALSFEVGYLPHDIEVTFLMDRGVRGDVAEKMVEIAEKIRTSPSIEEGISLRDLRNWALAAEVWAGDHRIDMAKETCTSLWTNVYHPTAVMTFVTRQSEQATRDALLQYLAII